MTFGRGRRGDRNQTRQLTSAELQLLLANQERERAIVDAACLCVAAWQCSGADSDELIDQLAGRIKQAEVLASLMGTLALMECAA